jgi:hypothetical protein
MESANDRASVKDSSHGKLPSNLLYEDEKHKEKIEKLFTIMCKGYGSHMVDWFNLYFDNEISGKIMTIKEYSKTVNEDAYFKILSSSLHQRTLKKIHFWILFWSVISIICIIIGAIYLILSAGDSYNY